jgi:hypothetical protein
VRPIREFCKERQAIRITIDNFVSPGGVGKAEGFADGGWAKPSASCRLPLPPAVFIASCDLWT